MGRWSPGRQLSVSDAVAHHLLTNWYGRYVTTIAPVSDAKGRSNDAHRAVRRALGVFFVPAGVEWQIQR